MVPGGGLPLRIDSKQVTDNYVRPYLSIRRKLGIHTQITHTGFQELPSPQPTQRRFRVNRRHPGYKLVVVIYTPFWYTPSLK